MFPRMIYGINMSRWVLNFKLEGRTANLFLLVDTYCYYFAKPEYHDEARLLFLANLEANKIIAVNKPRKGVWP